mmetsp:Transcript_26611/g.63061  ORF Transcript_26611/g.63061 Transcript_26611/m.63061 type:complete len:209 (-) Transcript_26611:473-1099(-)
MTAWSGPASWPTSSDGCGQRRPPTRATRHPRRLPVTSRCASGQRSRPWRSGLPATARRWRGSKTVPGLIRSGRGHREGQGHGLRLRYLRPSPMEPGRAEGGSLLLNANSSVCVAKRRCAAMHLPMPDPVVHSRLESRIPSSESREDRKHSLRTLRPLSSQMSSSSNTSLSLPSPLTIRSDHMSMRTSSFSWCMLHLSFHCSTSISVWF